MNLTGDPPHLSSLTTIFSRLFNIATSIIGLVAFIMLVIAAFTILTSAGNPETLKKGKSLLGNAILGLALVIIAWLTLLTIQTITGAPVTTFKLGF